MRRGLLALAGVALVAAGCSNPAKDLPGIAGPQTAVPTSDVTGAVARDAALARRLPASVRSAGALSFGTTEQPGTAGLPYVGTDDSGRAVGLHRDLGEAVSRVLGVRAQFVAGTFPTIVPGVQNGKFDVGLANFAVTAEREQTLDYATYLNDGQAFLGAQSVRLSRVRSLTDLCGLTVATPPGSSFQQLLETGRGGCAKLGRPPYTVDYFSTQAPILLGLANGKVDVEFGPTLSVRYDAAHVAGTKFLGQVGSSPVGFVTAKGTSLAPLLRDAVDELIADGTYARILAKWGITSSGIARSELNPRPAL